LKGDFVSLLENGSKGAEENLLAPHLVRQRSRQLAQHLEAAVSQEFRVLRPTHKELRNALDDPRLPRAKSLWHRSSAFGPPQGLKKVIDTCGIGSKFEFRGLTKELDPKIDRDGGKIYRVLSCRKIVGWTLQTPTSVDEMKNVVEEECFPALGEAFFSNGGPIRLGNVGGIEQV
jgi:hypothetical protein